MANTMVSRSFQPLAFRSPQALTSTVFLTLSRLLSTVSPSQTSIDLSKPFPVEKKVWTKRSKRVGVVGVKLGMTALWDSEGNRHPVTLVQIPNAQVIQARPLDNGLFAVQVGAGKKNPKRMMSSLRGHFEKHGVEVKRVIKQFNVTKDGLLPPGYEIRAPHFVPGQFVNVQSKSIGKGFQGAMKRWGFGGQPATHGVSVVHRSHGSTGCRQEPGRVWPGKKMAGRMGGDVTTIMNLQVLKVDTVLNLLYLRGPIAGSENTYLTIKDAIAQPFPSPPPYPTFIPNEGEELPRELVSEKFVIKPMTHVKNDWREEAKLKKLAQSSEKPESKGKGKKKK